MGAERDINTPLHLKFILESEKSKRPFYKNNIISRVVIFFFSKFFFIVWKQFFF